MLNGAALGVGGGSPQGAGMLPQLDGETAQSLLESRSTGTLAGHLKMGLEKQLKGILTQDCKGNIAAVIGTHQYGVAALLGVVPSRLG